MKVFCKNCGIHFKQDFKRTLTDQKCNYWGEMGVGNMPKELKKKIWDWLHSMPTDEVFIRTGFSMSFSIKFTLVEDAERLDNIVPGYTDMTEAEQQEFQRQYFKDPETMSRFIKNQQQSGHGTKKPKLSD